MADDEADPGPPEPASEQVHPGYALPIHPGDLIQITNRLDHRFRLILTVHTVRGWGVQAIALVPGKTGGQPTEQPERVRREDFLPVGVAAVMTDRMIVDRGHSVAAELAAGT